MTVELRNSLLLGLLAWGLSKNPYLIYEADDIIQSGRGGLAKSDFKGQYIQLMAGKGQQWGILHVSEAYFNIKTLFLYIGIPITKNTIVVTPSYCCSWNFYIGDM